MIHWIISL